ncbi:MAG: hypothetical protein WD492_03840 [Alkalispirochaeta sp.]
MKYRWNRSRHTAARIFGSLCLACVVVLLAACDIITYDYYNPLDPQEDATVETALAGVVDPELRRAIVDSVGGDTERSKREVHWVHASYWEPDGYNVSTVAGIEFFPEVSGLELSGTSVDWEADVIHLQRLPRLDHLNVGDTGVTDAEVAYFAQIDQLRWLGLNGNALTVEGLNHLVSTNIDGIALSGYDETDGNPGYQLTTGASIFEELGSSGLADQLWGIDLGRFGLTAADLTGLQVFPHLGSFSFWDNDIASVAEINDFLRNHNGADHPVHLGLWGNPIPEAELAKLDLTHISGLDLGHMGDGSLLEALPAFATEGSQLNNLGLQDNRALSSLDGLEQLLMDSRIEHLNLSNTAITDVEPLRAGDELRWIYLTDIITEFGLPVANVELLADLPNLEQLILHNTPLSDDDAVREAFDARPDIYVEYPDGTTNQL